MDRPGRRRPRHGRAVAPRRPVEPRPPLPAPAYPAELPIVERRDELLATIADHQVVVVAGETGSGKSTQLPKLCLELGRGTTGMIGHTQPRRIAARAVAERVAEELGSELGGTVGYSVRFTDQVGPRTYVKVMTDGILLSEIQRDRELLAYDTLIIDEAHERSLNIDFLLGYLTQLLPRRPDLKVVITSATIDTARFAAHFGDAPVVEVSGRTYPVEVRYRPFGEEPDDDRDQVQAVVEAVDELVDCGPGDILVFLSGEREIRDTADALERLALPRTEVLPLFARLSAEEQHRVFAPHPGRRVVVATNVAETSLTVPGVRYVVDAGTARISRYNRRTKVQRLPIEPVSQASANQRAGRCGRVAPGICIRLYAEEDFDARPEFTEPEVLRTNLASVILQMAAAGLGDVAAFPFVDPPDHRSIADGMALLEELGALDRQDGSAQVRLTKVGRRMARLPVDTRLARMVLEADRNGCLSEVLVIASALAIVDPRERPAGKEQEAAEAHGRFADPTSDFLAFLRLWEHLREAQQDRGSSAFRRMCRAEHLHYLRVREWQDVHGQLRQIALRTGLQLNQEEAEPDAVHRSVLAGLVSNVGAWDEAKQVYQGVRGTRFAIGRGSGVTSRPRWIVAAELVETDRLRARTVARIRPEWVERAAAHLLERTHGEPWWDERRGSALVVERVSLHGLTVAERRIPYERVEPDRARDLFIHHALVLGEWETGHGFIERNAATIEQVRSLEEKSRRRDVLISQGALFDIFDERIPLHVTSGREFDRWWRQARSEHPHLLDLTRAELTNPAATSVDPADFPDTWVTGGLTLTLAYRFEPLAELDGVTVGVPIDVLNTFDGGGLDWQVPGYRAALVTALVRSLPKPVRRSFVPVPDHVRKVLELVDPSAGPLRPALADALSRLSGERVSPQMLRLDDIEPHLRVTYLVLDDHGEPAGWSKDLAALKSELRARTREAIVAAAPGVERDGLVGWTIGSLPRVVEVQRQDRTITGYPALVDKGDVVAVRILTTSAEQERLMWSGTRRLLLLGLRQPVRSLLRALPDHVQLALAGSTTVSLAQVLGECRVAAVDALLAEEGGPVWDGDAFAELLGLVRKAFVERGVAAATAAAAILRRAEEVRDRAAAVRAPSLQPSVDDVRAQVDRLVRPGFILEAGVGRLSDVERYLRAALRRLEKLPEDPVRDRRLQARVAQLEQDYAIVARRDRDLSVHWMLQELRVSLFAQAVGAAGSVSEQRVRTAIARL